MACFIYVCVIFKLQITSNNFAGFLLSRLHSRKLIPPTIFQHIPYASSSTYYHHDKSRVGIIFRAALAKNKLPVAMWEDQRRHDERSRDSIERGDRSRSPLSCR